MSQEYSLEPIIEYQMDEMQTKAFHCMVMWLTESKKIIPNYQFGHAKMPKGDPRKSMIFRYCYKMVRDFKDQLADEELLYYIRAQLEILKSLVGPDGTHARIDAQCLVGPKAWARWCVWRKKLNIQMAGQTTKQVQLPTAVSDRKITADLNKAKIFFLKMYQHMPTQEEINYAIKDGSMVRWTRLGKVTPFYPLLSPLVKKALQGQKPEEYLQIIDLSGYQVTPDIEKQYQEIFSDEFK